MRSTTTTADRDVQMTWIGTSWKMNKLRDEARTYAEEFLNLVADVDLDGIQPFVLPPVTSLDVLTRTLRGRTPLMLGVQNAHWESAGAFTGELSMSMVADAGAELVEIGHAERRAMFGETDEIVNRKVKSALSAGLTPLVCVGEPADVFSAGRSEEFVVEQLHAALGGIEDVSSVVVAYEPVWAIGEGGRKPQPQAVAPVLKRLHRECRSEHLGRGRQVRALLYGGSVSRHNASELLALPAVEGLFIGRAAWSASGFVDILRSASRHATASEGAR